MNLPDPVNDAVDEAKEKAEEVLHSEQVQGAKEKAGEMAEAAGGKLNDLKEGTQDKFEEAKKGVEEKVDDWREQHK